MGESEVYFFGVHSKQHYFLKSPITDISALLFFYLLKLCLYQFN